MFSADAAVQARSAAAVDASLADRSSNGGRSPMSAEPGAASRSLADSRGESAGRAADLGEQITRIPKADVPAFLGTLSTPDLRRIAREYSINVGKPASGRWTTQTLAAHIAEQLAADWNNPMKNAWR
jgi:hypothetical protein